MSKHTTDNMTKFFAGASTLLGNPETVLAVAQAQERAAMLALCDEKRRLDRESRKVMAELGVNPQQWTGRGGVS